MNIREAHYAFKIAFDRVNSLSAPDFNEAEVDAFLNEAQLVFIKRRYGKFSNPKKQGFEEIQKRIDDLSTVSVQYPVQPAITPIKFTDKPVYEVSTSYLTHPYLFLTAVSGIIDTPDCNEVFFKSVRTDQLDQKLKDPFSSATVFYTMGRNTSGESAIYLFTSKTILEVRVSYIKYPSKVSTGNYVHLDGIAYPQNSFELPLHTHPEIVDIAAELAALSIQDPAYLSTKNQKVLVHE